MFTHVPRVLLALSLLAVSLPALAQDQGHRQHGGREQRRAQVRDHDPPEGRQSPTPEGVGRFDQRLQIDGRQPGVERPVGEGHGQHGVLERQQVRRRLE